MQGVIASCVFSAVFSFILSSSLFAADWPMLGGNLHRNPVVPKGQAPIDWDLKTGTNIKWTAQLGTQTYGTPVIADGQIYVGTNNGAAYLKRYPSQVDLGCLLCFRESDGDFLWQFSGPKHPQGRVFDWPLQGIGCPPLVQGERLWFISNRWEVVCLDTQGFLDDENDGPYQQEGVQGPKEADILWKFDLIKELGIFPHCAGMGPDRRCSIAAWKNRIFVITGNGIDEAHIKIPAPEAPSLVCLDKNTAEVLWTDNSPGANILHTQVASPLVAELAGKVQVITPQGDGWLRSIDAMTGKLIWKFDMNHKDARWDLGGSGNRNNILAAPVLYKNRIYIGSGQEVEHGEGPGRLVCIDPTKTGDISSQLAVDQDGNVVPQRRLQAVDVKQGERAIRNPNSGLIWELAYDKDGKHYEESMHRTISAVAVHQGLVIAGDTFGLVRCLDAETGKQHWTYDMFAPIWGSPLIVNDTIYAGDDDGDLAIIKMSADPKQAMAASKENSAFANGRQQPLAPIREIIFPDSLKVSPVFANGTLYVTSRSKLYAIDSGQQNTDTGKATGDSSRPSPNRVPKAAYVPTPQDVVEQMLELADVTEKDTVCDLGSGDGRIPITAAKKYGSRGVGYEFDAALATASRKQAKAQQVNEKVTFHQQDLFKADLTDVDVITLYLYPVQNRKLLPRLQKLKSGVRIVTHRYGLPGIKPAKIQTVKSQDSGETHTLHLYETPLTFENKN